MSKMNWFLKPETNIKTGRVMEIFIFYSIACLFMGISTYISGMLWQEANGPLEYVRLLFIDRPSIIFVTILLFVSSGVLTQIGKVSFNLSYYEISIIWFATVWVSVSILWFVNGIKPTVMEFTGFVLCQSGLFVVAVSKINS